MDLRFKLYFPDTLPQPGNCAVTPPRPRFKHHVNVRIISIYISPGGSGPGEGAELSCLFSLQVYLTLKAENNLFTRPAVAAEPRRPHIAVVQLLAVVAGSSWYSDLVTVAVMLTRLLYRLVPQVD